MGFIGTLLRGTLLAWFAPLLGKESPLLNDFEEFTSEFKACFGDIDSVRQHSTKNQRVLADLKQITIEKQQQEELTL